MLVSIVFTPYLPHIPRLFVGSSFHLQCAIIFQHSRALSSCGLSSSQNIEEGHPPSNLSKLSTTYLAIIYLIIKDTQVLSLVNKNSSLLGYTRCFVFSLSPPLKSSHTSPEPGGTCCPTGAKTNTDRIAQFIQNTFQRHKLKISSGPNGSYFPSLHSSNTEPLHSPVPVPCAIAQPEHSPGSWGHQESIQSYPYKYAPTHRRTPLQSFPANTPLSRSCIYADE